ncbi:beta-lactamase family protein [Actinosynnema pretiosum subsp. pretiosum]|uniref:Beta-lactamase family protein n=1 Tax=Actinosynnema pretiosum subsp. pretiosum TaxID=103721 RepID=A0AA45L3N5_9PSEU|nr:D-alanyl-D-alanine carboxypeptidase [Actinosynnema pretiosum subsp. pretiosum]QUF02666.1 beta-lactamase family protein [Actinosynnema pretiosum subsp. pretiosum]
MRLTRGTALVAAASLALVGIAGTATAAPSVPSAAEDAAGGRIDRAAVQKALDDVVALGAQGVQVRLTDGRQQLTARAGTAERGSSRPVPLNGRYRVGSITKTFVSVVVLQLVGEGKAELDQPISHHLPGLLPDGDRITVRMLLQHTSGLHDYTTDLFADLADFQTLRWRTWQPSELVALSTAKPLDFEPGSRWSYSNTNYVVLGELIAKLTGRPYGDAVERRVLKPLGLRDTSVPGTRVDIPGPHAHGYLRYAPDEFTDATRLNPSMAHAAGEMISTTADTDRFVAALLGGELLKPALLAEMLRTSELSPDYGLGVERVDVPCGQVAHGHSGGIPGYSSMMISSGDTRKRLELSVTTGPDLRGQPDEALRVLLTEVFC